jgi:hypothetical protein
MGLKQVAQKLNPVEWRSAHEAEEARRAIVRNSSSALEVDHEKALAELRAFERRALKKIMSPGYQPPPPPSEAEVRVERLREVLDYLTVEGLVSSWEKLKNQVEFIK